MNEKKYEIDMSRGPMLMNLLRFAMPLLLTGVLQLFYNAADIVVVGRFSGSDSKYFYWAFRRYRRGRFESIRRK